MLNKLVIGLLLCLMMAGVALAQEGTSTKVKAAKAGEVTLLADKSADIKAALDTDGFKLPGNIGELIDKARESGNPAETWPVALSLMLAEKASGSESELVTSRALVDEATDKARRNKDAANLAMAAYAYQNTGDDAMFTTLMAESQAAASAATGEKAGPYTFDMEVNNYWNEPADIYLEDAFLGTVYPGYYLFWSDLPIGYYYLYAYGLNSGGYTVVEVSGTAYSFNSVDLVY
jgi:hypothetical protein